MFTRTRKAQATIDALGRENKELSAKVDRLIKNLEVARDSGRIASNKLITSESHLRDAGRKLEASDADNAAQASTIASLRRQLTAAKNGASKTAATKTKTTAAVAAKSRTTAKPAAKAPAKPKAAPKRAKATA